MKFKTLFVTMALFGLMIFCLVSFIYTVQKDNGAEYGTGHNILDNKILNKSFQQLESNLSGMESKANTQKGNFEGEAPTISFGSLVFTTITSIGKVFNGMIVGVYNLLIKLPMELLGVSPVIAGVISTILVILIILGLWEVYKLGG
ncbi:MAG: hypothetical protein WC711_04025 [Candidatus Staskawiczbacteria bacterium]|jgi:hypothetical protein